MIIKNTIELLKVTELKTESIRIAQGKNKFPSNIKEFANYIRLK